MAGPESQLQQKPSPELAALRPALQSELTTLTQRYGIDLGPREAGQLVDRELSKMKTAVPPEIHARMEKALFEYVKTAMPERATSIYNQMEGARYYDQLGIDKAKITLQGVQTTVGAALNECAAEPSTVKRLSAFLKITAELAEQYRLLPGQSENGFGIKYDKLASDPANVLSGTFNCFSGAMSLGQIVSYAAGRVDLEDNVKPKLQLVASWSSNGKNWDDMGHAMLRLDLTLGKKVIPMFFDPMNGIVSRHESQFAFNASDNTIRQATVPGVPSGGMTYRLSDVMTITPALVNMAKFQDRLFGMETPTAGTRAEIAQMPPVFAAYYASNMDSQAQRTFFDSYDLSKVQHPTLRYQLSTLAAVAFSETDQAKALELGKTALSALREVTSAGMDELGRLPLGGFFDKTIALSSFMQKSAEGQALLAGSRMWVYIPIVVNSSAPATLKEADAKAARNLLADFYNSHPKTLEAEAATRPTVVLSCCAGLIKLNQRAYTSTESEKALNTLYANLGIDRQALLSNLKSNALEVQGMNINPEQVRSYLDRPSATQDMEIDFIRMSTMLFPNEAGVKFVDFYRNLGARVKMEEGVSRVHWMAIYETLSSKEAMTKIALPRGPVAEAFRNARLASAVRTG